MQMNKAVVKELRSWGIIIAIFGTLYFTGALPEVAGFAQRAIVFSGLVNPDTGETEIEKKKAAFDFTLTGINGENIDFNDLKGKVIFVNLWATWCAPCIAEMPSIESLYADYEGNKNLAFAMISLDKNHEKAIKFMKRKGYSFPAYLPDASLLPKVYESNAIPTTYVIDKEGFIVYEKKGMSNYDSKSFHKFLNRLIQD